MADSKQFSKEDVSKHSTTESMWVIVDDGVYDLTPFQDQHPGGSRILKRFAGKDTTNQFWKYHNESVLKKYGEKLKIGTVKETAKL